MADLMDVFDRMLPRPKNPLNPVQQLPQGQIRSICLEFSVANKQAPQCGQHPATASSSNRSNAAKS